VIWRGLPIGRIMKPLATRPWWWGCNVYGQPPTANDRGPAINFKTASLRFKIAWTRIRAGLTEEDIAVASRHAAKLAEEQPIKRRRAAKSRGNRSLENNRAAPRQRTLKPAPSSSNGGTTIASSAHFGHRRPA